MKQIQFPKMSMLGRSGKGKTSAVSNLATSFVSQRKPDGLIASTGNLYFTSHDSSTASIWRTAQTANPGTSSFGVDGIRVYVNETEKLPTQYRETRAYFVPVESRYEITYRYNQVA